MISFNVGPSKIYPQVKDYLAEAYNEHILSISHRSAAFDTISKNTLQLLHEKLNIPPDYTILYTTSATESWEIISQDLVTKASTHFYNGEFGKKWFEYAQYIHPHTQGFAFNEQTELNIDSYPILPDTEVLCFTLNETSTGTQVNPSNIKQAKQKYPNALVAIDTTSCLGGINIDFVAYDIIYGSVQKCFGLPAGLGILIISQKALQKAEKIGIKGRYNSLLRLVEHIQKFQTSFTPNVLGIYLLGKILNDVPNIAETDSTIINRAKEWYSFVEQSPSLKLHIQNPAVRSNTVITIAATEERVTAIKKSAKEAGFELGSGYGKLKNSTFRIANFPALTHDEIADLKSFLQNV